MNQKPNPPSSFRYFLVTGTFNRWFPFAFLAFAAWIAYTRWSGGQPGDSYYTFLFFIPFAAGTGLLTCARRGELDLLFGAGQTRTTLWCNAFAVAWVLPALMAVAIVVISAPPHLSSTLLRLLPVLLLTGGVGFAAGLVETRYFAGVIWLLTRLMLVLSPSGLRMLMRLEKGIEVPSPAALGTIVAIAPENLLEPRMPVFFLLVSAVTGGAALTLSYVWFRKAEFGGKRA